MDMFARMFFVSMLVALGLSMGALAFFIYLVATKL